jgi:hypothetical protein
VGEVVIFSFMSNLTARARIVACDVEYCGAVMNKTSTIINFSLNLQLCSAEPFLQFDSPRLGRT